MVAISLIGVIALGAASINTFSQLQVASAVRRAQLQNEISLVLEHMTKQLVGRLDRGGAIGSVNDPAVEINSTILGNPAFRARVDANSNGMADVSDKVIGYRLMPNYEIWYYDDLGPPIPGSASEVLSTKTVSWQKAHSDNYIVITLTSRWDPSRSASIDNPEITMRTLINMPAVSTH